jgi:DNA-binding NarL/FixJ family response regulator
MSYTKSQWGMFLERVTELYRQGKTYGEISQELNLSEDLIRSTIETYVISPYKTL